MGDITDSTKVAYGDESIRLSAPTPVYLVAATVLPDDCNLAKLARIKPKAAAKLHWRELTDKLRQEALAEVAAIGGQTTIVAASPLPKKKQERGRRKCLELLLPELEAAGIGTLILESRVLKLNDKDIEMLDAMRAKRVVSGIELRHVHASDEPKLWVPDQVLGAYGDCLCGDGRDAWRQSWEKILPSITVLQARM